MTTHKAIIFDFYGVLRLDPYNKWLSDHNYKREGNWREISDRYDRGMISSVDYLNELSSESGIAAADIKDAFVNTNAFDDEVVALLSVLKSKYKVGLLSNAGGPGLRRILQEKGIEGIFDEIIISGEVGYIKPEREIFEIALQKLDVQAGEAIFIDDNPQNIDGADQLGIHTILFTSARQLTDDLTELGISI